VSVRLHVTKLRLQTSRIFLYVFTVVMARSSSDGKTLCYVLPVLCMTSCLATSSEAKAPPVRRILKVTHKGAAPGRSVMSTIALLKVVALTKE